MSVLYTDDPKSGNWNATPAILHDLQDPEFIPSMMTDKLIYFGALPMFIRFGARN